MSEIKHTPGPWYWDDRYPASEGRKTWSLIGANGYGILSCDGEENSPQGLNDHVNACLIAAAPELLEAAEAALKALEAIADEMTVGDRYTNAGQHLLDALTPCRDAIAKATGAA